MNCKMNDDGGSCSPEVLGKKPYVKPAVAKHTAASVIVGSGCNDYTSTVSSNGCDAHSGPRAQSCYYY